MRVILDRVNKKLRYIPPHMLVRLQHWIKQLKLIGIEELRKHPGYRDKLLKGERKGQRCIRLSKSWRVFYIEENDKIIILEINHHEY